MASGTVWSTKSVQKLVDQIGITGVFPLDNPFYEKDLTKFKANISFEYTEEELIEQAKCMDDVLYFAETQAKINTDDGVRLIKLHPYQVTALLHYEHYDKNVYLASRQIGKSWSVAIFVVKYVLAHTDKTIVLASSSEDKVLELMERIDTILQNLPYHMKPGMVKDKMLRKTFDNGCRIIAQTTTENTAAGYAVDVLYLDEFALVHKNLKNKMFRTVFPTISSRKGGRLIITSTARGRDKFASLYLDAVAGKNNFNPLRTDWWEYPGRDEKWKADQIADLGSEADFNQEFGCQFDEHSTLLFKPDLLKKIKKHQTKFVQKEFEKLNNILPNHDMYMSFHPAFNIKDLEDPDKKFVISIDLAEGGGNDYTVANIKQLVPMSMEEIDQVKTYSDESSFFKLRQVGMFRSNIVAIPDFALFMYHFLTEYCEKESFKIVLEMNYKGDYFYKTLEDLYGDENQLDMETMFIKFPYNMVWKDAQTFKVGIMQSEKSKDIGCKLLVDKVKYNQSLFFEWRTCEEGISFSRNKGGEYSAEIDNDDCILTEINIVHVYQSMEYREMCIELFDVCSDKFKLKVEEKLNSYVGPNGENGGIDDMYNIFD